ncbi:MAG: hypothetical protein L0332_34840 [Chloroflexi bacterium]|nr:hypothetical protein [Chloroflexota bacterium]MCI0731874.1 hypothetical protein [Chloroflexota bacterium]
MKRVVPFLAAGLLCLILLILLAATLNAPRLAEARAHEAAAKAMQAQATATILAIAGLLVVALMLALAFLALFGLLLWWLVACGRHGRPRQLPGFTIYRPDAGRRLPAGRRQLPAAAAGSGWEYEPDWDTGITWDANGPAATQWHVWEKSPWDAF